MLIKRLKEEYELRYRFMRYEKMYRLYLCVVIEQHNFQILENILEDMNVSHQLKSF